MSSPGQIIYDRAQTQEVYGVLLPSMTTTERNNLTAVNGMILYNTTTTTVQVYQNGAWKSL